MGNGEKTEISLTCLCTALLLPLKLTQHVYLYMTLEELLCWIKTFGVFRPD